MDKLLLECNNHIEFHQKIIEKMKSMSMMLKTKNNSAQAKVNCMLSTLTKLIKEHENNLDMEINQIAHDMESQFARIQQNSNSLLSNLNEFKHSVSCGTIEDVDASWSTLDNMIREHHNQEDLNRVASYTYLEFCPNQNYAHFFEMMQNPRLGYIRRFSTQPGHISLEALNDAELQPGQTATVLLRNRHSEPYLADQLRVNVVLAEKHQNIPCNIATTPDRSSGTITSLTFMPQERGEYTVEVSLYGEKVYNSPLMLSVGCTKPASSAQPEPNSGQLPFSSTNGFVSGTVHATTSSHATSNSKTAAPQVSSGIRPGGSSMGGSFRPRFACAPTHPASNANATSAGSVGSRLPGTGAGNTPLGTQNNAGLNPRLGCGSATGPVFPTPTVGQTSKNGPTTSSIEDDFFGLTLRDTPQLADTSIPLPPHIAAALKQNTGSISLGQSLDSQTRPGIVARYDADGLPIVDKSLGASADQTFRASGHGLGVIDSPIDNLRESLQDPLMPQVVDSAHARNGSNNHDLSASDFVTGVAQSPSSSSLTHSTGGMDVSTKLKSSVSFADSHKIADEASRISPGSGSRFSASLSPKISSASNNSTFVNSAATTSLSNLMNDNLMKLEHNEAGTNKVGNIKVEEGSEGAECLGRPGSVPQQSLVNGFARVQRSSGDSTNVAEKNAAIGEVASNATLNDSGDWWIDSAGNNGMSRSGKPLLEDLLIPNMAGKGIHGEYVAQIGPPAAVFGKPIGCTKNEVTKQFIVCDKLKNCVRFFSEEGKLLSSISRAGDRSFKFPSCALALEDGRLVLKDDFGLFLYSKEGDFIRSMGIKDRNLQKPYGLALRNDGVVITLDVPPPYKGGRPSITMFDPVSGKMIEKNLFRALSDSEYKDSKPYFINCYNDTLIVSDLGHHVIHMVDLNGLPRRRFGGIGDLSCPGKFREPSGITVDGAGYMIIGDAGNHRVQIFNPYGEYVGPMELSRSIQRPSSIHLTHDGHLMVNNLRRNTVSIFKLQSHPL